MTYSLLKGIRVIDLSHFIPGPYATLMFADLGAEIIKVEPTDGGDKARVFWPEVFELNNRGKKSVTVNLKTEKGRNILYKLIKGADIFIEGFRPGVAERLGMGYGTLATLNPGLIYCSISGFGQGGPYRDYPAHDINYLGIAGLLSLKGDQEMPAVRPGIPLGDLAASLYVAVAVLAALHGRARTGKGCQLDASITDCSFALAASRMGAFLLRNEEVPADRMNHLAPTNKVFMAGDGRHLTLGIIEDHFWQRFCVLTGMKDLQTDPRYSTHQARIENGPSLISELKAVFLLKDRDSWLAELRQADIPCGPVNSVYEAAGDPQLKNRGMIRELTVDTDKKIRYVPYPVKFVNCESGETVPPPTLGRDTEEVLRDVGLSEEEVMMLSEEGVI